MIGFLLALAMGATLIMLLIGITGFIRGGEFNQRYGNKLMRARVGFQFLALALLTLLLMTGS